MQNKAKFLDDQMNVSTFITKGYENKSRFLTPEKQSQTNPNKPKFKKAKMNVTSIITKDYENNSNCPLAENKPNSNPNKPNFPTLRGETNPKQSQFQTGQNSAACKVFTGLRRTKGLVIGYNYDYQHKTDFFHFSAPLNIRVKFSANKKKHRYVVLIKDTQTIATYFLRWLVFSINES